MNPRPMAVLDRDGTIIAEKVYLSDPRQVELLPGAAEGLRHLARLGLGLVVVTNQSGVGRGYFDLAAVQRVHQRMADLLAAEGVKLSGIYLCPHLPDDDCDCRKPRPGLVEQAAADLGFEPASAVVIGDKPCDVELGQRVGAVTVLVRTGYGAQHEAGGQVHPDHIVDNLAAAGRLVEQILQVRRGATVP
jgi:histidinol-phosphate phosphatase family protein